MTTTKTILLHGDLHHENILSYDQNTWVAIDPKGVIGDPIYDIGPFICNPWPELLDYPDIQNILQSRIKIFADHFGFDRRRIIDWLHVQSVLFACWAIEDNLDFKAWLELAHILANIIEQIEQQK